jgi:hypothetical protein
MVWLPDIERNTQLFVVTELETDASSFEDELVLFEMEPLELESAKGEGDWIGVAFEVASRVKAKCVIAPAASQIERFIHQTSLEIGLSGLRIESRCKSAGGGKRKKA